MKEEELFKTLPESFTRQEAMNAAKNLDITKCSCDRYILNWRKEGICESIKNGSYKKISEFRKPDFSKYLRKDDDAKKVRAFVKVKLKALFPSLFIDNLNLIRLEENYIVLKIKVMVPLPDVLMLSDELYKLKTSIVDGCEPNISIGINGIVTYDDLIILCKWSPEEMELAKNIKLRSH